MSRGFLACWCAAYALLAVITFPLATHLSSAVPHDLGDPLLSTSILWWNAHVVPLTARWWDGFAFFPATGMMAFSDHRLGLSVIASPLQWLGCSPVTAYNVTLLATFPLCAIAAHGLAFTLTRRHDTSVVCGLAYGFNPYRVAHIEHLELLAAFAMPAALAALHLYAAGRKTKWLVAFGLAGLWSTTVLSRWLSMGTGQRSAQRRASSRPSYRVLQICPVHVALPASRVPDRGRKLT